MLKLAFAGLVALAVGCGESPEAPVQATLAGLVVEVESSPAHLQIRTQDGQVILDGLPGGEAGEKYQPPLVAAATRHSDPDWDFKFGAFKVEENRVDPWSGVTKFVDLRADAGQVEFDLRGKGGADLGHAVIAPDGDAQYQLAITVTASAADANRVSLAFACDPDEHFLGFGGQTADVDHHGQTVPLWVSEDGIRKAPVDTYDWEVWFLVGRLHSTHTPMPIYLSSRGYALLLDTPYRSIFAMGSEGEEAVRIEAWEPELRLHLFWGPTSAEALTRLTDYVGRPELPPAFTFAPWLDAIFGSANVRRVAQALRDADVPASVIWTEDWRGGNQEGDGYVLEEDWEVDRDLYPDFEAVASDLHDLGYKFLTYCNTFLDSEVPVYDEAVAGGYTIQDADGGVYLFDGVKFNPSTLLDLSNPDAVAWAKQKYRAPLELGSDGYMADFAEWLPQDAVLYSGEDAMARHNLYPVDWARLNKEILDDMYQEDGVDRLFFLRAAYLGSQPLVSVVWAGDQQTDFTTDDGMPSVIPMGIGLGVTGFPYFGSDIAGYMSQATIPTTKELWFRWVTLGALSPVMRTHHGRNVALEWIDDGTVNWNWESDAESTAHLARWARFHIRLFPYLYAMAEEAATTGMPMMRALAMSYPEFAPGWTAMDQFMLGDRLIVAPVVEEGATGRQVALPAGDYYSLIDDAEITVGSAETPVDIDVPVDEIAVLVPAGTLLALLPEEVDTLVDAADASVVTLADVGDDREIWLWPGGASDLTEVGGLAYSWDGGGLTGPVTGATYDSATVPVQSDADGSFVELTGPGTLVVDGGATLTITGGAADRAVTVRFRGL